MMTATKPRRPERRSWSVPGVNEVVVIRIYRHRAHGNAQRTS
jgi:hypothetical protein